MKQRGLSQEGLKIIACVTMLIDHIGAVLLRQYFSLRMIGRIAFPIYCFLLAEGAHYTKSPKKYALRLGIGMLLSELPFDLAFSRGWSWGYQSVMVTLLLGFLALKCMEQTKNIFLKLLIAVPFAALAEICKTDYGASGVALIVMFGLTRTAPKRLQFLGVLAVLGAVPSAKVWIGGVRFSVELLGILAMVPIFCYSGRKLSSSRALQWAFYLFYPVHLAVIWLISIF